MRAGAARGPAGLFRVIAGLAGVSLGVLACPVGCAHKPASTDTPAAEAHGEVAPDLARAARTLAAGAEDLDVGVRARSLELLILTAPEPGAGAWAERALWDPSPWVQRSAIRSLEARLPEERSRDLLRQFVGRPKADPYALGAAGLALALAGDASVLPELRRHYEGTRSSWKRLPIALAAAAMGDGEALAATSEALTQGDLPLELTFLDDLGRSGLEALIEPLLAAEELVEEPMQLPIAATLMELGSARGEALLRKALSDRDEEVVLEALDLLVASRSPQAPELLRRAASGAPPMVETYARLGLLSHGLGSVDDAVDAAGSEDREVRALAMHCVGLALARGRVESVGRPDRRLERVGPRLLVGGLADEEDMVREEAVRALARVGAPQHRAALSPLLEAEALALRVEVAGAMLSLGTGG